MANHSKGGVRSLAGQIARRLGAWRYLKRQNKRTMREHCERRDLALNSYPTELRLELSTRCDLRCRMCSISRPSRTRKNLFLKKSVVDTLRPVLPYLTDIKLNGGGEPFLLEDIVQLLETFASYGIKISTTTNGMLIDRKLARLIGKMFSSLRVSVDGATRETYEMIREKGDFNRLLKNLDLINEYRPPDLPLIFAVVGMQCNLHELPDIVSLAQRHAAEKVEMCWLIPFKDLPWTLEQDPTRVPDWTNQQLARARDAAARAGVQLEAPRELLSEERSGTSARRREQRFFGNLLPTNRVTGYCDYLYRRSMVLVDGQVKPCPLSHAIVGNVLEQPFEEIWKGPRYQSLRASIRAGVLPRSCRSCNFIRTGNLATVRLVS